MTDGDKGATPKVSHGGVSADGAEETREFFLAPSAGGGHSTIHLPLNVVACWRVDDIRFEFGSSFILPEVRHECEDLKILLEARRGAVLSIFGHADPVGNDPHNKKLSGRRAQAVYAMLTRNTELWEDLRKNPIEGDKWDFDEIQIMLKALGYYSGPVTGKKDADGKAAVQQFQREHGLDDDGDPGSNTCPELYKAYMDLVCVDQDGKPFQLDPKKDFITRGADDKGKGDYQGCSEFNPRLIFSEEEHKEFSKPANKEKRNEENTPNRRVVMFLFQAGTQVSPDKWPCPRASEGINVCKNSNFWPHGDQRRSRREPTTRREFDKTADTFACKTYQRFALRAPCEGGEVNVHACAPTFFMPKRPGSKEFIRMPALYAYVATYKEGSSDLDKVEVFKFKDGKLVGAHNAAAKLTCGTDVWMYCSHLHELEKLDQVKYFAKDGSGLPLLGPLRLRRGSETRINVDVWQQKDWLIVIGKEVDGTRPEGVKLAEWKDDYSTGIDMGMTVQGDWFQMYTVALEKEQQEKWAGKPPTDLLKFGPWDKEPVWIGTQPFKDKKAKLILISSGWHVATFNEIQHTGDNQEFLSFHHYKQSLVSLLSRLSRDLDSDDNAMIDSLPAPPQRCLLPGDIYWQGQGSTNNCGAYSFSGVMNYWFPYTNNITAHDGVWYSTDNHVPYRPIPSGARTPNDIQTAAQRFNMHGLHSNAEDLDKQRALKVLKLWIQAGVPVLFLVKEYRDVAGSVFSADFWSYHWKILVGYDGNRFFMRNSGADREYLTQRRTPGVDYETAPIGNDVDSEVQFYDKWKAGGGDVVDALLAPSVDECSFVPLYPNDSVFAADEAK